LCGKYEFYNRASGETGDTLIIEPWGYRLADKNDKEFLGRGVLGDTLVMKEFNNHYFINWKVGDQWVLRIIKPKSPGVWEFLSIDLSDVDERKRLVAALRARLPVKEMIDQENHFYQINPTPAQLNDLIRNGFFQAVELRKIK
jgi:hypothetical protein